MKIQIMVALYGSGLAVSTVGACLANHPEFRVIRIEEALPDDSKGMDDPRPDVILFDLSSIQAGSGIPLAQRYPGIMLVGIDLTHQTMLVLSGESSRMSTTEDLIEGIEKGFFQKPCPPLSVKGEHNGVE